MIGETGIWSAEEASTGHIFSYRLARWMAEYFDTRDFIADLGCGRGTYLQYLNDREFKSLLGIDGISMDSLSDFPIHVLDLTHTPINIKSPMVGWRPNEDGSTTGIYKRSSVICLEVFEHIPEQYENALVDNICALCTNKLLISVAVPGQSGLGHVNCRSNEYIIDLFTSRGFTFNAERTASARSVVEDYVAYFRETLMVFER